VRYDSGVICSPTATAAASICNDDRRFLIETSIDLKTWIPWYGTTRSEHGELHFCVPAGATFRV